jgi:hypothetical protein
MVINYMLTLFVVMVIAGGFGGLINYFLTIKSDPENAGILKSVTVGIGASFLVPLFLNMISSNLIDSIKGTNQVPADQSKLLVFAGFCLVAAISSTAFIRTLSDRILSEAKAARKEAEEAKLEAAQAKDEVLEVQATIDPIIDKETEPEPTLENAGKRSVMAGLSEDARKLLDAFARSKYTHRSVRGLSKDTGLEPPDVERILADLVKQGLVSQRDSKGGLRWFITQEGLNA